MRKLLNIAMAAAVIGGAALATAAPASADDWRGDRGGWHQVRRGDRDDWRGHDRWRDRDWRGGYYGYGRGCYSHWQWSYYWHRYVRVSSCY